MRGCLICALPLRNEGATTFSCASNLRQYLALSRITRYLYTVQPDTMPPALETIPDLDPLNRLHTCPRCGETWAYRSVEVALGCLVSVLCPSGHRGSVLLWDLPDPALQAS